MDEMNFLDRAFEQDPSLVDKSIAVFAIVGVVAVAGLAAYGVGKLWYKFNEKLVDVIWDKIMVPKKTKKRELRLSLLFYKNNIGGELFS